MGKRKRIEQRFEVTFTVPVAVFSDKGAKPEDMERFLNIFLHGHIKKGVKEDGRGYTIIEQQAFNGALLEHSLEQLFKVVNRFFQADRLGDYEGIGEPEIFVMGNGMGDGIMVKAALIEEKEE